MHGTASRTWLELELRLQLIGGLVVWRGTRALPARDVGSRKARLLLALLAVERCRLVSVDRIIDVLWTGAAPRRPVENVATLVSRLRAALGSAAVTGGRRGYRLGGSVTVDVYYAVGLVQDAESRLAHSEPVPALVAATRALDLLDTGMVLADEPDADWAEPVRAVHERLLRRARHAVAEAALRAGDAPGARAVAEDATAADPLDEVAHQALMRAHDAVGEPVRALTVYQQLRDRLASELGIDPAPTTRELHAAILQTSC